MKNLKIDLNLFLYRLFEKNELKRKHCIIYSNLNFLESYFAKVVLFQNALCHDSATKIRLVNSVKKRLNFLWKKRYSLQIPCAMILPQNSDYRNIFKNHLNFLWKKSILSTIYLLFWPLFQSALGCIGT